MAAVARPLLRWHGGKWILAPWIIQRFPPYQCYVDQSRVGGDPPGNCFRHAGWHVELDDDGNPKRTKERGLLILFRP